MGFQTISVVAIFIILNLFFINIEAQTTNHPLCPPSGEMIYLPYPGDCNKYIQCYNGDGFVLQCPPGLWWNPDITQCDYPGPFCDNGTTNGTTTTPGWTETTTPSWNQTTTPSWNQTTSPSWNETTVTETPTSPAWNETTTSSTTSTTPGYIDPRCPETGIDFFPHPASCNLYIQCYDGSSFEMQCPEGLFFSESQKRCVDVSQSECCQEKPSLC